MQFIKNFSFSIEVMLNATKIKKGRAGRGRWWRKLIFFNKFCIILKWHSFFLYTCKLLNTVHTQKKKTKEGKGRDNEEVV